ncbi:uncharacterized protein [Arachis hypogaea]|uniref:uncharacterized protein n=1 Tax=Arachis hypogaea TaxID=3818 RepID=UPI003B215D08
MGFRRCWGLTAAIPVVAGVVTGEDHRSCCLPLPRGSASFRSPLPPELPRTTAVAAAGIVNGRRRCCFRYSHSRRRSQPRRRTELPENATAATELHWRSPLLLGADCRAAAEPVRRPPLFRFSRSFGSDMGAEVTKSLFNCCCDALYCFSYGLLYPRLDLDITCKRDRNCIGLCL